MYFSMSKLMDLICLYILLIEIINHFRMMLIKNQNFYFNASHAELDSAALYLILPEILKRVQNDCNDKLYLIFPSWFFSEVCVKDWSGNPFGRWACRSEKRLKRKAWWAFWRKRPNYFFYYSPTWKKINCDKA